MGGRQQDETEGGRSAAGGILSNEPDIGGEMLSPCEPPLSIAPNQLYRAGFDLVTFRAEGVRANIDMPSPRMSPVLSLMVSRAFILQAKIRALETSSQ